MNQDTIEKKFSVKDKARQAFRDQQTQDNEGGVPCAVSFITGFLAGHASASDEIAVLKSEISSMRVTLNTLKNDYWFMINLIERYSSNKEDTLRDVLDRLKFRKNIFKKHFSEKE